MKEIFFSFFAQKKTFGGVFHEQAETAKQISGQKEKFQNFSSLDLEIFSEKPKI